MNPLMNKYLKVITTVKRGSKEVDEVICLLDKYFELFKHTAFVTSILRTAQDQLRIIIEYAKRNGISVTFSVDQVEQKLTNGQYIWQDVWSKLLNKKIIINPPLQAQVLYDYISSDGKNKKGEFINPSAHFYGYSFDIGGGVDGIKNEVKIVQAAINSSLEIQNKIKSYVIERANNALHIDVVKGV